MKRFKFKNEDLENVKKLYKELKSTIKVAKYYNCDLGTVLRFLKKNNVEINMRESKSYLTCDETVFDEINQNSAYWIGFMMADGYHNVNKNFFTLVQRESEGDNLEKFKEFLKFSGEIKYYKRKKGHGYGRLYITNLVLSKRLNELGIVQAKTHILEFPNYIDNELLFKNFLRGYFDGDGSISAGVFSIVGNEKLLLELQNNIIKYLGFSKTNFSQRYKDRDNRIMTMAYGGKSRILELFKFMYKDANYFSRYKYDKFIKDTNDTYNMYSSNKTDLNLIEFFFNKTNIIPVQNIVSKKSVYKYSLNGKYLDKYSNVTEAAKLNNLITCNPIISSIKTSGTSAGFQWRYDFIKELPPYIKKPPVIKYEYLMYKNNFLIKKFNYFSEIEIFLNEKISYDRVLTCCVNQSKIYLGYNWSRNKIF